MKFRNMTKYPRPIFPINAVIIAMETIGSRKGYEYIQG